MERSQGGAIPRWRGVVVGIYELPFGPGTQFGSTVPVVINHLINNWTTAGTYVYQTGLYFTPSYSGVDASNTNRRSGRPDRLGDGNLPADQRTIDNWFDTGRSLLPPPESV